jgi:hypothetical protein
MPAGKPWIARKPRLKSVPDDAPFWRVYSSQFHPLSANRYSKARFALIEPSAGKESVYGMFYVANDLSGVLWETVLRYVVPDEDGRVRVDTTKLSGMRAIRLELVRRDVPMLELGQPGLRNLFPHDSEESVAVAKLIAEPDHALTHPEIRALRYGLKSHGIEHMPVLSWPSRQHNGSRVYLAYQPPMREDWWRVSGPPVALDEPDPGYRLIAHELARCGFVWEPCATTATPAGEDANEP